MWFSKGAGVFSFHEEQTETVLRQEGSALHYLQLLPEKTVTRFGARKEYVRENSWGSAGAPSVLAGWVCADAGARAPVGERTCGGHTIKDYPDPQTKSFSSDEAKKETRLERTTKASIPREGEWPGALLAETILRF